MEAIDNNDDAMLYANFNQDGTCFAIGTEKGFRIYNTDPIKFNFERTLDGGIGIVEMLNRCNILALVGGGKNPKYSTNKVVLWDDHQEKMISELRFNFTVRSVKLKKDKIFVVCEKKIYVFNFLSFKNIDMIDTYDNPKGIVAISTDPTVSVIAYPDKTKGYVSVKSYDKLVTALINAHNSAISFLTLNSQGKLLATASENGKIIRIFRADNGTFLQELRRGKEKAEIFSISFDLHSMYIASSSDRGTIHIWSLATSLRKLKENDESNSKINVANEELAKNNTSVFNKILGGYFNSEWSFAQFRLDDPRSICSLGDDNTLRVISSSGNYYRVKFDPRKKGECTKLDELALNICDKEVRK